MPNIFKIDDLILAVRTETRLEVILEAMPQDRLYFLARESIKHALQDAMEHRKRLYSSLVK